MKQKSSEGQTMPELKKQIRELHSSIAEAILAKRGADTKKLRRKVKKLKARTRALARAKKSVAAPPPAAA